jgi:hypothetical protein
LNPWSSVSSTKGDSAEAAAADFAVTPSAVPSTGDATRRPVITFVTGNLLKLKEAQHILDATCSVPFELVAYGKLDLDELQSDIPEKIAAAKCRLAALAVGGPVMIDDTSLCFNALGGLPGPYIKWCAVCRFRVCFFAVLFLKKTGARSAGAPRLSTRAGSWTAWGAAAS